MSLRRWLRKRGVEVPANRDRESAIRISLPPNRVNQPLHGPGISIRLSQTRNGGGGGDEFRYRRHYE